MRPTLLLLLAVTAAAGCGHPSSGGTPAPAPGRGADLVVVNAKIFTADPLHPYAEALAIQDGRFLGAGSNDDIRSLATDSTPIVDAGGRLVTPGLIEAHAHFDPPLPGRSIASAGDRYPGLDADQVLAAVAKATRGGAGWISGNSDAAFETPRNWRHALDAVAPRNPVVITDWTAHSLVLNTAALEALDIRETVTNPVGGVWGRDATGALNGLASDAAAFVALRRIRPADPGNALEAETLQRGAAAYARWGVTTVHHMADDLPVMQLRAALAAARLPIRWTVFAWGLGEVPISEEWRRVDNDQAQWPNRTRLGGLKWILDGDPMARGAFQLEDYADRRGWRGRSNYSDAELRGILVGALESGHQVALHASGDAEAELVLRIMGELAQASKWRAVRVRMEHGDGLAGDRITRAAAFGIVVDQQPVHLAAMPMANGEAMQDVRFGTRANQYGALRSLLDGGIRLALSSDANAVDDTANPFLNIMIATTYPRRPEEAITREQALTAYTAGGAYAEREELRKGRIAPGFAADMAVLSNDVLTVPADALPTTTSLLTLVDGVVVHASAPFAALAPPQH